MGRILRILSEIYLALIQARAPPAEVWCSRPDPSTVAEAAACAAALQAEVFARSALLRTAIVRQQLFFPDRRLIQFDCGKLQVHRPDSPPSQAACMPLRNLTVPEGLFLRT